MTGLISTIDINIRFSETDAMGVVWHGNYLKFFEDAREKFGMEHNLEYLRMYHEGFFTPIVESKILHKSPINYGEKIRVTAKFIQQKAAKIHFDFEIENLTTNTVAAIGYTTQIFLNKEDRALELIKPAFFIDWEGKQKWVTLDS